MIPLGVLGAGTPRAGGSSPTGVVWGPTVGNALLSDDNRLLTPFPSSGSTGVYARAYSANALTGKTYLSGVATASGAAIGIARESTKLDPSTYFVGVTPNALGVWVGGSVYTNNNVIGSVGAGSPLAVEIAVDVPNRKVWVRKNGGSWVGGGDPVAGTLPTYTMPGTDALFLAGCVYVYNSTSAGRSARIHTAADLSGSAPSGFTALLYAP